MKRDDFKGCNMAMSTGKCLTIALTWTTLKTCLLTTAVYWTWQMYPRWEMPLANRNRASATTTSDWTKNKAPPNSSSGTFQGKKRKRKTDCARITPLSQLSPNSWISSRLAKTSKKWCQSKVQLGTSTISTWARQLSLHKKSKTKSRRSKS